MHVDIIRVGGTRSGGAICLVRTYQVQAHNAAHGDVKDIVGEVHHSLWLKRVGCYFVSRFDGSAVIALLASQWRQHVPVRCQMK